MTPAPLNQQRNRSGNSLEPPDPLRRPAVVEAIYWIDMRTGIEGGRRVGWHPGFTEIICAEPPTRSGDCVAGWMTEVNEDSYWAGRDNVIVAGIRVDDDPEGISE